MKAVITAASPQHRNLPVQTLSDPTGEPVPLLSLHLRDLDAAGIHEVAVIHHPEDGELYQQAAGFYGQRLAMIPQDRPRGFISAHGRGSLIALSEAIGADLDERRFRSNIAVDGLDAWAELEWAGRVRIGAVEFEVSHHIVRCLATHANPETGERDAEVMTTLTRTFGQEKPTFGTLLLPTGASAETGGTIHVGDEVEVIG